MPEPAKQEQRRTLHYQTLDDLQTDIDQLLAEGYHTIGEWNFSQILQHLAAAFNASFDGFSFQFPWPMRKFANIVFKKRFLTKTLPSGYKIPSKGKKILLPDDQIELDVATTKIREAIIRLQNNSPDQRHPVLESLTAAEWLEFHLRHAELHMSFVLPGDS